MNNKKLEPKQYLMISIIYAAVFAIYNIIVFLAFDNKNNVFWTSYAFMCVAFAVNVAIALYSFRNTDMEAIFWGIPLLSLTMFYFFGELFVSFVFMLFRSWAPISLTVAVQVIIMLIFIIVAVFAIMSKDAVESISKDVDRKSKTIKLLSVDVKMLEDQCMDRELKMELHKVAEAIRFSDPMTNEFVAELDNIIRGKVSELKYYCQNNNKNDAMQICFQLNSYISERNQKLILTK